MALAALLGGSASKIIDGIPPVVWKVLLGTGLGVGGYVVARKIVLQNRFQKAQANFGQDTNEGKAVNFASLLFDAMFPSGVTWIPDGTNEELMFEVAADMHETNISFETVAKMYKHLFQRELFKDISVELGGDDKKKFNELYEKGLQGIGKISAETEKVMTIAPAAIYDSYGKAVKNVPANLLLGEKYRQKIKTPKGMMIGFSKNGQSYFVNANKVITYSMKHA